MSSHASRVTLLATGLLAAAAGRAAAQTWSGLGANNLWNTPANWQGGVVPVSSASTAVVMTGTTQTNNVLNLGGFQLNSLTFAAEAGPFTIGQAVGEFFNFAATPGAAVPAHIDQFSASPQAINFPGTGFVLNGDWR